MNKINKWYYTSLMNNESLCSFPKDPNPTEEAALGHMTVCVTNLFYFSSSSKGDVDSVLHRGPKIHLQHIWMHILIQVKLLKPWLH